MQNCNSIIQAQRLIWQAPDGRSDLTGSDGTYNLISWQFVRVRRFLMRSQLGCDFFVVNSTNLTQTLFQRGSPSKALFALKFICCTGFNFGSPELLTPVCLLFDRSGSDCLGMSLIAPKKCRGWFRTPPRPKLNTKGSIIQSSRFEYPHWGQFLAS